MGKPGQAAPVGERAQNTSRHTARAVFSLPRLNSTHSSQLESRNLLGISSPGRIFFVRRGRHNFHHGDWEAPDQSGRSGEVFESGARSTHQVVLGISSFTRVD
jgi:hypothetical protein